MNCPICTQALAGGELIMVCTTCHKTLGGGLSLGATGEFTVPSPELLDTMVHSPGEQVRSTNVCSWCGKLEADVKKLLGRNGTGLCNECVALACDIMEAELGPDWR